VKFLHLFRPALRRLGARWFFCPRPSRPIARWNRLWAIGVASSLAMTGATGSLAAEKVARVAFRAAEKGFDPAQREDRYSIGVMESIFEPLLTYDHLARPVRLVPLVVEAIPEPQEGGTLFEFRIRRGIYFQDDPAFKGKKRELVAKDMEYAIKRFRDPANRSPYEWLFEGKIVGLDEAKAAAEKSGKFDYDARVEGLQALDRYTLRVKLKEPDFNFIYFFAMPNVVPVAREVIEAYPDATNNHPVGTGPYRLKTWAPRSKIVLEKNPSYRGFRLDETYANADDEWDRAAISHLRGKTLPLIDRIEIYPIEEEQPRFLAFMNREHDFIEETPFAFIPKVLPGGRLSPELERQGVRFFRDPQPEITYFIYNMEQGPLSGFTPERIALRRALSLAYNRDVERSIIRKGQVSFAEQVAAPGIVGFDPNFRSDENAYNPARAKALLDMFGYRDIDGDGFRETPDGQPINLEYKYSTGEQEKREIADNWVRSLAAIGIRTTTKGTQFADLLGDRKRGRFILAENAWVADYPDAQNFLQLLYGPNTDQSNDSRFRLKAFDELYERALRLPDSPERNRLYREMNRLVLAYAPWRMGMHRVFSHFMYPWVKGYKKHPILFTQFKYLDIDVAARDAALLQR
jgi:oligopeptide transport system substrate-binding protein